MDAVAAGGGVEDEAGGGVSVIGDLGALVGGEEGSGVAVAGDDDGEATGGERGSEGGGEGQGEVFFEELVAEAGSGVGASVGGVEEDDCAGLLGWEGDGKEGREDGEPRGDGLEGWGQGS